MTDAKLLEALVAMLSDESPRKRIAAAVVLGELRVQDAKVIHGLSTLAADPVDALAAGPGDEREHEEGRRGARCAGASHARS